MSRHDFILRHAVWNCACCLRGTRLPSRAAPPAFAGHICKYAEPHPFHLLSSAFFAVSAARSAPCCGDLSHAREYPGFPARQDENEKRH